MHKAVSSRLLLRTSTYSYISICICYQLISQPLFDLKTILDTACFMVQAQRREKYQLKHEVCPESKGQVKSFKFKNGQRAKCLPPKQTQANVITISNRT